MTHILTIAIPFIFYPALFIGLFFQYGLNPFAGVVLGLVGAFSSFFLGKRFREKDSIRNFNKNLNLALLVLICVILSINIWGQAIELKIENFVSQIIMLLLTFGLCAFALLIEMFAEKKTDLPYYEMVERLLNDIFLVLSMCVSSIITGVVLMIMLRLHQTYPGLETYTSRFLQRGVIPPLTLFLFILGLLILLSKYRKLNAERIQIHRLIKGDEENESVLYRALKASSCSKPTKEHVETFMNLVWSKFNSFYNLPRYITWAIPILGFLGTVLGISLTAEGISDMVNSQSGFGELSSDLGKALSPLGIAFDTTLVALSLSLVLVFIQLVMQRWEEKLLTEFESHVENHLLNH